MSLIECCAGFIACDCKREPCTMDKALAVTATRQCFRQKVTYLKSGMMVVCQLFSVLGHTATVYAESSVLQVKLTISI